MELKVETSISPLGSQKLDPVVMKLLQMSLGANDRVCSATQALASTETIAGQITLNKRVCEKKLDDIGFDSIEVYPAFSIVQFSRH